MFLETAPEMLKGIVEIDKTYAAGKNKNRHANKKKENTQGRSGEDKTPVIGLLQRGGNVLTFVVPSMGSNIIHPIAKIRIKTQRTK
jgi:hypothetical protein